MSTIEAGADDNPDTGNLQREPAWNETALFAHGDVTAAVRYGSR